MKLKYFLTLAAGALLAFSSCVQEDPIFSGEDAFQISPSLISVGKDGGEETVEVNTTATWTATSNVDWITVTTASNKVTVTVDKNDGENARQGTVDIKVNSDKRVITVKQAAGGIEYGTKEHPYPVSKLYDYVSSLGADAPTDDIYFEGIIYQITENFNANLANGYGNATFTITDDGKASDKKFLVYRALYIGNKKYDNAADKDINLGDKVVLCGQCVNYKGNTPETNSGKAYLISIEAGTSPSIAVATPEISVPAAATSAKFSIATNNLTENWTVTTNADWIKDWTKSGKESGSIDVSFEANTVETPREAVFTVKYNGLDGITLKLTQEAFSAISDATAAEINAKEDGSALFRLKGVVTEIVMDKNDATKYNVYGNFYISDETGSVYVYGLLPEAGGAAKQDVLTAKGVKVGDVITVVGPKGSHKDSPQMVNAYYESHVSVTAKTATEFNALEDGSDLFLIKGKVKDIVMDKNDPTKYNKYGNFYVEDETGSVYVYGIVPISTGKSGQDILTTRGVKAGDIVTVVGPKGSHKGSPQMVNGYLAAVEPGADAAGITIDGEFSDWAEVATGVTSAAEVPVYAEFKAASDGTNLYFYAKRDNRAAIWAGGGYFYFDVDADNNSETGTEKDGVPGLESWFYIKPFAGTADAHAIATEFKGEGMEGTVISNIKFAGLDGESYVEFEASIPIADMNVTKGSTIKIYSWGNKDGYDVQKMPVTLTIE